MASEVPRKVLRAALVAQKSVTTPVAITSVFFYNDVRILSVRLNIAWRFRLRQGVPWLKEVDFLHSWARRSVQILG